MDEKIEQDRLKIGVREWAISEARYIYGCVDAEFIIVTADLLEKYVLQGWVPELKERKD